MQDKRNIMERESGEYCAHIGVVCEGVDAARRSFARFFSVSEF